jgi:heat shock protein HslJ
MGNANRGTVAAVIAAASVAVLLAGCAGTDDASPSPGPSAVVSPSASTPPSDSAATPSAPGAATGVDAFVGSWGTVDRQSPHLVIAADGTFTGSDGCNTLRGTWEPEDDGSIEFDDVAMTRMACEGVDQTLNRLDSATVAGDELTVYEDPHGDDHDGDDHDGDDHDGGDHGDGDHRDDAVITLITLPRTA